MSTRYVWNACGIDFPAPKFSSVYEIGPNETSVNPTVTNGYKPGMHNGSVDFTYSDESDHQEMLINRSYPCSEYPYVVFNSKFRYELAYSTTGYWYIYFRTSGTTTWYSVRCRQEDPVDIYFNSGGISTSDCAAGSVQRAVSNSGRSYRPDNGIDGEYWYKYLGSDTIDPAAITVKGNPRAGEAVTISVTPGSGKIYGGTVSYIYQYCVNGGAWTNIETTTSTSVTCTVPASAKTIQFRARAKDDMGFTSSDYVTTDAAAIERLNLWAGVGGKARKATELYVGVGGKARKVVSAYVGVNGKARRFL